MEKLYLILMIFIGLLVEVGCTPRATVGSGTLPAQVQEDHPLVGTWILFNSNNSSPEGGFFRLNKSTTRQMKILNPTHFMFIQENVQGGESEFTSAAGGRYELRGNTYIEYLDYASWENYKDSEAISTWRVEGNKWYHQGVLNTADGDKYMIEEVWERVDP